MTAKVFSLPVPLIVLVHLYILQYPHANKPEYDHKMFDPRIRGLRDRTRTMEDICYFLVSRIEGKEGVRKVIPTYPCSQPAETTAFRTSLAKFLESLRHTSIFPTSNPSGKQPRPSIKATPLPDGAKSVAWWWKDVVVRKSLLEECAGERFERLLLALSTHALKKGSKGGVGPNETHSLLKSQPRLYMTQLAELQLCHDAWVRKAFQLLQQQRDLKVLRANIMCDGSSGVTRYTALSTEKLRALADSKLSNLLATRWAGPGGCSALRFLSELYGLERIDSVSTPSSSSTDDIHSRTSTVQSTPPPPLPIAAAHHPAILRQLSRPIFPIEATANKTSKASSRASPPHAAIALSGRINAEARMLQSLTDALARTRKTATELRIRFSHHKTKKSQRTFSPVDMNLCADNHRISVDFEPQLTETSFLNLGLPPPGSEAPLQSRIDDIRRALLPEYPVIPTAAPANECAPSRLPQSARAQSPPHTPKRAQHLHTSTPPDTVKPRSSHAHRARNAKRIAGEYASEDESEHADIATPRAPPKHSLKGTPPLAYPSGAGYRYGDADENDDPFDEGPSMSVRDLLLQADTTHFDIIGDSEDDSGDFLDQSFEWA
ncbi:hypothetical protein B0H11DRAFT_834746 [Mycena galericulata]|nr:hypothetical protein B0H11DRAFT_834746 [Mycena galericulata]